MVVLAVDTSHPLGSVALSLDGEKGSEARFGEEGSHVVELSRTVDRLLRENGMEASGIDRVALVIGPGSFTGLRVGMSYVKGLYAGLKTDVVTIGTLELLALPLLGENKTVCAMVDASKGELYGAVYESAPGKEKQGAARALIAPQVFSPEKLLEAARPYSPLYVGNGAVRYRELLVGASGSVARPEAAQPSAAYLAAISHRLAPLPAETVSSLEPLYLRSSDAVFKPLRPVDPRGTLPLTGALLIEPLQHEHIPAVLDIEKQIFSTPWTHEMFQQEVEDPDLSRSYVATIGGAVVGYLVAWFLYDEVHLLNIAVSPRRRGQGIGRRLMKHLIELAVGEKKRIITLEVREGNVVAIQMYKSFGFAQVGLRRGYYQDDKENAVLMAVRISRIPKGR